MQFIANYFYLKFHSIFMKLNCRIVGSMDNSEAATFHKLLRNNHFIFCLILKYALCTRL
jgi:hypothetical protein